jgi:hypothetical protein
MPSDRRSKLPLPVEVTGFEFLSSPAAPTHAVLEFWTEGNPLRVFLTKAQLQELASKAAIAAIKIQSV